MKNRIAALAAVALLASVTSQPASAVSPSRRRGPWDFDAWDKKEPINTGRRAEKDAEALRKAEAKRARKNAKRLRCDHTAEADTPEAAAAKWHAARA